MEQILEKKITIFFSWEEKKRKKNEEIRKIPIPILFNSIYVVIVVENNSFVPI